MGLVFRFPWALFEGLFWEGASSTIFDADGTETSLVFIVSSNLTELFDNRWLGRLVVVVSVIARQFGTKRFERRFLSGYLEYCGSFGAHSVHVGDTPICKLPAKMQVIRGARLTWGCSV